MTAQALFQIPTGHTGPMAQTHGFRDLILAAIQLRKSLGISTFRKHFGDSQSEETVPFGLRFDAGEICKLVHLEEQSKTVDDLIVVTSAVFSKNHTWQEHLDQCCETAPQFFMAYGELWLSFLWLTAESLKSATKP